MSTATCLAPSASTGSAQRILVQRGDADAAKRADILHRRAIARRHGRPLPCETSGREEHAAGAAVIPDLIEFARRQPRVDDDRPGVEPARGEQQTGQRDAVLADDHHAVAGADAERAQRIRGAAHRAIELAIGQAPRRRRSAPRDPALRRHAGPSPRGCGSAGRRESRSLQSASSNVTNDTSRCSGLFGP